MADQEEQKKSEKWSEFCLLAEVASLEYERLHSAVSVEVAIEEPLKAEEENRDVLVDPLGFIPKKKRTPLIIRPSVPRNRRNPRPRSSSPSQSRSGTKRPLVVSEGEEEHRAQLKKPKKYDSEASSSRSSPPRETRTWLVNVMREMGGDDPRLIVQKNLYKTDVSRSHGRLSIPFNSLVDEDFMTAEEERIIEERCRFKTSKTDLDAVLVDPLSRKWTVIMRRWDMNCTSSMFVLISTWNDIVDANEFMEGDAIELWSFRSRGRLCFALVPRTKCSCNCGNSSSAI